MITDEELVKEVDEKNMLMEEKTGILVDYIEELKDELKDIEDAT